MGFFGMNKKEENTEEETTEEEETIYNLVIDYGASDATEFEVTKAEAEKIITGMQTAIESGKQTYLIDDDFPSLVFLNKVCEVRVEEM